MNRHHNPRRGPQARRSGPRPRPVLIAEPRAAAENNATANGEEPEQPLAAIAAGTMGAALKVTKAQEDFSLSKCDGLPSNPGEVKAAARKKLNRLVKEHGYYKVHSVVWMPNWADNHPRKVPCGFAFAVRQDKEVPLVKELFTPEKFFYGTIAVLIPGNIGHLPSETEFSAWLKQSSADEKLIALSQAVPDEALDFSGSYAGLYSAVRRTPRHSRHPYTVETWLVLQCGAKNASMELYRKIEDGVANESTWEETLFSGSAVGDAGSKATNYRRKVAWKIMQQLGLKIGDRTLNSFTTIETVTNTFDVDYTTNTYVYYSGCTPVSLQSVEGIIMGESPSLGPTILRGPDEGSQRRRAWRGPAYYLNAFPSGTGRRVSLMEIHESDADGSEYLDGLKFCWKDQAIYPNHPRLFMGLYRMRDVQFRLMEQKLGYNHAWESLWLRPLAVKLAPVKTEKTMADLI